MITLIENIKIFLIQKEFEYYQDLEKPYSIQVKSHLPNSILSSRICYLEDQHLLLCLTDFPIIIPAFKRKRLLHIISDINNSLLMNSFLFNVDEGIIKLKSNSLIDKSQAIYFNYERFFFSNIATMDRYIPDILKEII